MTLSTISGPTSRGTPRSIYVADIAADDLPDIDPAEGVSPTAVPDDAGPGDASRWRSVIEHGAEYIGAAAGGAIGLVGGPPGAIAGAVVGSAIGHTLERAGMEVYDRLLVRRQQQRVGAVLALAEQEAIRAQQAGGSIRTDGFFEATKSSRRSGADEVLEGVLLHAADAYEERKLRHLAAILPSVAMRSDISVADAHLLTRLADRLSWRQLLILGVLVNPPADAFVLSDVDQDERGSTPVAPALAEEVDELGRLGLLGVTDSTERVVRAGGTFDSSASIWGTPKARWRLTELGHLFAAVTRLDDLDPPELTEAQASLLA